MADPEEFRRKIQEILPQEYKIEFLGSNFDKIAGLLTEPKVQKIYSWIKEVLDKKIQPITIGSKNNTRNGI